MMKHNEGFTLVETVVSIRVGTIATAAVATLLLIGLRINAKTTEIATRDNQAVICLTVMENLVKSNNIDTGVTPTKEIKIVGNDTPLFTYTDDKEIKASSGAVLLENVADCKFSIANGLLTIELKLDEDEEPFVKTIRLRTGQSISIP